jgi:hypothetical protein
MKIVGGCILAIVVVVSVSFLFFNGFFTSFIEATLNEKPEIRVIDYLKAVKENNEIKALTIWKLPEWEGWKLNEESSLLKERRQDLTESLVKNGVKDFNILQIEWWNTCCEPSITNNRRDAGGARIRVQLVDSNNSKDIYIFDVFHRETSYWGPVLNYPVRHWVLRDIYPANQEPLFWKFSAQK